MNPACEIVVTKVLPVIRANLAKSLIQEHGFTQQNAAKTLNITQPAISQYLKELRGQSPAFDSDKKLKSMVSSMASDLAGKKLSDNEKTARFCELCKYVRSSKLICKFHPPPAKTKCSLCFAEFICDPAK